MHPSCVISAERFVNKYLDPTKLLKILDVGSFNVNGTLKPLFTHNGCICSVCGNVEKWSGSGQICSACRKPVIEGGVCDGVRWRRHNIDRIGEQWQYIGMDTYETCKPYGDMNAPPNRRYSVDILMEDPYRFPFDDNSIDVVVSTSCLEHDPLFWVTFNEMVRVLALDGLIYLNVPSSGPYHGFPDDCWRFQVDAYKALTKWNPKAELLESYIDTDISKHGGWADNVGIFRKKKE